MQPGCVQRSCSLILRLEKNNECVCRHQEWSSPPHRYQERSDNGSVGTSKAIATSSDGEHIVVVNADGKAKRYRADNGSDTGSVGTMNVVSCNISGGIIILGYRDGKYRRYDA